jgi:hypothetical protein
MSLKLSSINLGSSKSNKLTYVGKVGELVLPRTSCSLYISTAIISIMAIILIHCQYFDPSSCN